MNSTHDPHASAAAAHGSAEKPPLVQTITPELRTWIIEQAQAGCHPDDVIAAMKASGWNEDVAVQAMEHTLGEHLAAVKAAQAAQATPPAGAAANRLHAVATAQPAVHAPVLPPAVKVPDLKLQDAPTLLQLEGHTVRVLGTMRHPRVVMLGGFLTDDECTALMDLAQPRLARSETVDNGTGGSEINAARTSDGMFFERGEAPLIKRIEARIALLLGWPVDHGEGMQVLRYRPGAEYRPHHDYFDPVHPGTAPVLLRGGQRVGTLVMYLNTPEGGGATTFPDAGFEVMPVRGNAVFFSYDRAHACTGTLHGGAPVLAGEKWVATKWLRQGVFV